MATVSNKSAGTQISTRGVSQGITIIDPKVGQPVETLVDIHGVRRLAVDANLTLSGATVTVDLDVADDGVHIGDLSTGDTLTINPDGSINSNVAVDAADGDSIAISGHTSPLFAEAAGTLTALAYQEIFTYTSISANTKIIKLECTASTPATFRLLINGIVKKQASSSPLERNVTFQFIEHRPLLAAQIITIEALVDRLIDASYDTFTSLEGYVA